MKTNLSKTPKGRPVSGKLWGCATISVWCAVLASLTIASCDVAKSSSLPSYTIASSDNPTTTARQVAQYYVKACQAIESLGLPYNASFSGVAVSNPNGGSALVSGSHSHSSTNTGSSATDSTTYNLSSVTLNNWVIYGKVTLNGTLQYYNYSYYSTSGYGSNNSHSLSLSGSGLTVARTEPDSYNIDYGQLNDTITLSCYNSDGSTVVSGQLRGSSGGTIKF